MIVARANIILIYIIDAVINADDTVCNQNIKFCDNNNNFNNIDEKYVNSDSCNLLDILAALMKT